MRKHFFKPVDCDAISVYAHFASRGAATLPGVSHLLVCRTTTGQERSSQSQATDNYQTTSAGGAGSVTAGAGSTIEVGYTDQGAVNASAAIAQSALAANNNIANNAVANNTTATANAFRFGAEALSANTTVTAGANQVVTSALTANNTGLNSILTFGAEALRDVTLTAAGAQHSLDNIANQFGQITANAAPQTTAAQTEILAGSTPLSTTSTGTNWEEYAIVGGFLIAAIALLYPKGS